MCSSILSKICQELRNSFICWMPSYQSRTPFTFYWHKVLFSKKNWHKVLHLLHYLQQKSTSKLAAWKQLQGMQWRACSFEFNIFLNSRVFIFFSPLVHRPLEKLSLIKIISNLSGILYFNWYLLIFQIKSLVVRLKNRIAHS